MKRTLTISGVAVGLLASAALTMPAHADKARPKAKPLAETNFAAQQVAAFWFGENMANLRNATPYNVETKVAAKLSAVSAPSADSKPGVVGSSGDQKATTSKSKNVNLPRTVGKVFFIGADGKPHWCSATAVQSAHKNLVATAGHCVYDTKTEKATLDKWVFVPGYYQGKTPWGIYVGKQAFTHFDFNLYADRDYDYAFVAVYDGVLPTGAGVEKDYKSELYNTKREAQAALRKLKNDKSTVWSKLSVREVTAKGSYEWVPAKVSDVLAGNKGVKLGDLKKADLKLGKTWKAGAPVEVRDREFKNNATPNGISKDGLAFYWTEQAKDGGRSNQYTYDKYFKRTFTELKKVGAGKKYQVFGKKATINLKDVGKLGDNVGGQGLAYNQKVGQPMYVFGYPSGSHPDGNYAFTGKTMKYSYGKSFATTVSGIKADALVGIKSSFTGEGALGSAWLYRYDNTKRLGYLNGVTVAVADTDGNRRYDTSLSPYFDGETLAVYKLAAATRSGKIV